MCYSAQVESKWRRYVRDMDAQISLPDFYKLAQHRLSEPSQFRIPRGFDPAHLREVLRALEEFSC